MISSKPIKNPFPGLRPFETDEYRLFFGREGQSDQLLARLQRARFLAVVGTSGSGKSSLIRAGLMPALRGGMMPGAGSGWRIAVMRPGGDPFGNLAAELARKAVLPEAGAGLPEQEAEALIEATLRSGSLGIVNVAYDASLKENEKLLLVVDQFEELFRFRAAHEGSSVDEAAAFVKLLLEASQQRELSIYVVLTMRSDFLGDCAQFQGLPEAINDGQYLIPRMTRDERRVAVTGPIGVTRGKISEPLINRLLNDVGDNPDQLPILQHALMRTWAHWQGHHQNGEPLGLHHYEAIGTMTDALSRHADEAFKELPDERSRKIAENLFKALSERGADNREIRRPTRLDTICKITGASIDEVVKVIDVFRGGGRSFLMPPFGTTLEPESVIDISHESLIRNWQRLKDWVNEEAQSVRVYRRVAETAVLHREGSEGLMQDPALQFALDWRAQSNPNAAWGERYHPEFQTALAYLEQSRIAREERLAAEQKRRNEEIERDKRELEQTRLFVAQQARAARRMRFLIVALCVILLFSIATAAFAWNQRATAILSQQAANRDREIAVEAAKAAEYARLDAKTQEERAQENKKRAISAQQASARDKQRAEDAARLADEKRLEALRNLEAAQAATTKAKAATRAATDAVKRGELIREGLESTRREDFVKARDAFEELQQKLKTIQTGSAVGSTFTQEQTKQFATDYGWTLSRLGDTYHKLREYENAIKDYENGRAILENALRSQPAPILFETYHGLAHAYHDNAIFRAAPTNTEPTTISLTPDQQLSKAEEFYKKALNYQETHLKSDNPLAAVTSLKNLAQLYIDIGKYDEAEEHLKRVVDVYKTVEYRPGDGTVGALRELGDFYRERGRYPDAARAYNELIDVQEGLAEESDAEAARAMADSYNDLSQVYNVLKQEQRSEAAFRIAERIQQIALKFRNKQDLISDLKKLATAITLDDDLDVIGDSYITLERFGEAARSYNGALWIRDEVNSENEAVAISYLKLGDLYRKHYNDYDKAETYYKQLIERRENAQGNLQDPSDPLAQYVVGLRRLASLYADDLNRPADAEALLNKAIAAIAQVPGRSAWTDEQTAYGELLSLYQKQQKDTQPVLLRKLDAMSLRRNAFMPARPSAESQSFMYAYVTTAGEVADLQLKQNDKSAAIKAFGQVFNHISLSASFLDAKQIDRYLTNLEKYQALLRERNGQELAAKFDNFVRRNRARLKELEIFQQESQEP